MFVETVVVCDTEPIAIEGLRGLLESADGQLRICKYVGFEPAQWVLPEPKLHIPVEAESASPSVTT